MDKKETEKANKKLLTNAHFVTFNNQNTRRRNEKSKRIYIKRYKTDTLSQSNLLVIRDKMKKKKKALHT